MNEKETRLKLFGKNYPQLYEELEKKYNIYTHGIRSLIQFSKLELENILSSEYSNAVIVDLGCGTGISTYELSKSFPKAKVIGIDISLPMIKFARKKIQKKHNVAFVCGDGFRLSYYLKHADAVFSSFTYYYFINRLDDLFSEVFNSLNECGVFCFNITSYLTPIEHSGENFNEFAYDLFKITEKILKRYGIDYDSENWEKYYCVKSSLVKSIKECEKRLKKVGFSNISERIVEMPISCQDALKFTYEGFWKFSKKVSYCSLYSELGEKREKILREVIMNTLRVWRNKNVKERPRYFEVKAFKI